MMGRAVSCLAFMLFALEPMHALGPAVVESHLDNGARVLVSEQRNLPLIVIGIMVDAGSRWDPPDRAGVANLTADLLTEGTKTRSAATIKQEIDALGGYLSVDADADYAVVQLRVLKSDVAHGIDLLSDILLHAALTDAELARRKEAALAQIRSQRDDPTTVAQIAFQGAIFGTGPYGHPVEGTERTVSPISRADVRAFYARYYRPAGASIVVVGDIGAAEAHALFAESLAQWRGWRTPPASVVAPPTKQVRIDKPVTRRPSFLAIVALRTAPRLRTISVMNYILGGGGFSSRLMDNIRTKAASLFGFKFLLGEQGCGLSDHHTDQNASVADAISRAQSDTAPA
jgi:zinc protease